MYAYVCKAEKDFIFYLIKLLDFYSFVLFQWTEQNSPIIHIYK